MNAPRDDGGPAFPVADFDHQTFKPKTLDEHRRLLSGMTLRDYFAAKAMAAMISGNLDQAERQSMQRLGADKWLAMTAESAYRLADAMLLERTK